jgi:hypothetical protein
MIAMEKSARKAWRKASLVCALLGVAAFSSNTLLAQLASAATADGNAHAQSGVAFSDFVRSLSHANADAYLNSKGAKVKNSMAFEEMRQHLLGLYSGVEVPHSLVAGRQIFDCVPVLQQPSLRGTKSPILAAPPPFTPPVTPGNIAVQELHDALGYLQHCENGTIPMRRLTLRELTRFESLRDFLQKGRGGIGSTDIAPPSAPVHGYGVAEQDISNWGGYGAHNLWSPFVNPATQTFSLSQQWYRGGTGAKIQTAEVGVQNYPTKYLTENSVLFIYWTANHYGFDGGKPIGCYNLECKGFVQTNNNWHLGHGFTHYSTQGGTQYEVDLGWYLYQGSWWLMVNGDWVGYLSTSYYIGGQMSKSAQLYQMGGESAPWISWPPIGSGGYPSAGYSYAAYDRWMQYYDSAGRLHDGSMYSFKQPANTSCYNITTPTNGGGWWREYFYFGGPGAFNC